MEDDKQKAVDIRKTAMESLFADKNEKVSEESAGKKLQRSESEAIDYEKREKSREELRIKEQEMQFKREQ